MRETINPCARAEDLVTYLYAEATADEARDFEVHASRCDSCRAELAAFGCVREAIGDWRQQALGALTHPAAEPAAASASINAAETPGPRRASSALAALREFFALSTAWMRAAAAGVAVAFCALVVIAVAHFVERPRTVVVKEQVQSGYTEEQVRARVDEALRRQKESGEKEQVEREKIRPASEATPEVGLQKRRVRRDARPQLAGNTRTRRRATSPAARPSAELASTEYLPFTAGEDEERLPSLVDLVDDAGQE